MMTRNSYALNMGYVMRWRPSDRARDPRGEHGRRQEAVVRVLPAGSRQDRDRRGTLTDEAIARVLRTTAGDLEALAWAGTNGAVASGMQSVAFTPASAIAAIFTATGRTSAWSARARCARNRAARRRRPPGGRSAFPGSRSGPSAAARRSRSAATGSSDGLRRPGQGLPVRTDRRGHGARARDLRLGGDGTAGRENFFRAHHERGGLRS